MKTLHSFSFRQCLRFSPREGLASYRGKARIGRWVDDVRRSRANQHRAGCVSLQCGGWHDAVAAGVPLREQLDEEHGQRDVEDDDCHNEPLPRQPILTARTANAQTRVG